MPGLSMIFDTTGYLHAEKPRIRKSLQALLHDSHYEIQDYIDSDHFFLASTHYREYPVHFHEDEHFAICLEGIIYNAGQDFKSELTELMQAVFIQRKENADTLVHDWMQEYDGDYIVAAMDKKNRRVLLFNDSLGRLPIYMHEGSGTLIISRELQFVANLLLKREYDRMGIAQQLLFGHPLGQRTILTGIKRALQCLLVLLDLDGAAGPVVKYTHTYNFEKKKYAGRSMAENAAELEKLFYKACKSRISPDQKNLIGLSGGLDSRSVAAALSKLRIPFTAVTRLSMGKKERKDVEIAEKIAKTLHIPWLLYEKRDHPRGKDLLEVIKRKSGLNNATVKFMIPYLEEILRRHGRNIRYFTGDGGLLLKDQRPAKKLKNEDELVQYTVDNYMVTPLSAVSALTFFSDKEIINEIKKYFFQCPETGLEQKLVHYVICEYGFKYLYEGEDRNRSYFWSLTPFYANYFFDYAMNCPDAQKYLYKLYQTFLSLLSVDVAAVSNANWGAPAGSINARISIRKLWAKKRFRNYFMRWRTIVKKPYLKGVYAKEDCIIQCILKQSAVCQAVGSAFDINYLLSNLSELSKPQVDVLFTVTTAIELFENGASIMEQYREADFA